MSQNYNVFPIDLSTAGSRKLSMFTGVFRMVRALNSGGSIDLSALVEVRLGDNEGDWIPISYGNAVFGRDTELNIQWEAQAGVTAYFFRSADPNVADVDADPPAQLVIGSLASSYSTTQVTVGVAEVSLKAANSSRKSVTIYNNGSTAIEIINTGEAFGAGLPIASGANFTLTGTTAEIFAISDTAGQDIRIFEEG